MDSNPPWTLRAALVPFLSMVVFLSYGIYLLAYPPPRCYKKLSILLLAIPVAIGFWHQQYLTPFILANDTFARCTYIWLAHMSYEVIILEFEPHLEIVKENVKDNWKIRIKQAWQVLYNRHHDQRSEEQGARAWCLRPGRHGYSRIEFVVYHVGKVAGMLLCHWMWEEYQRSIPISSEYFSPERAYFFRRLFSKSSTLDLLELWLRFEMLFDWTVINMFFYEAVYSMFAVLFVGILRFDDPEEWTLNLCNNLLEAWSVRRYWGKHWHNYIYNSFSTHIKVVSREWLTLDKGKWYTRFLENSLVFLASGMAHTLVRWQQRPGVDAWVITIWYVAQMLPIVIEVLVQDYWRKARQRLGINADDKRVNILEKALGYLWVSGWFYWSIPKYVHTRNAWRTASRRRQYMATHGNSSSALQNETQ